MTLEGDPPALTLCRDVSALNPHGVAAIARKTRLARLAGTD